MKSHFLKNKIVLLSCKRPQPTYTKVNALLYKDSKKHRMNISGNIIIIVDLDHKEYNRVSTAVIIVDLD
jgi:hypothetical protein